MMTYTYTVKKTVTVSVKDIYGTTDPLIPKGFQIIEFRPPKTGERFLALGMIAAVRSSADWNDGDGPRLILQQKPKGKRIIYTQVRTGTPQMGEFYQSKNQNGEQMFKSVGYDDGYARNNYPNVPIFKREEEEIEL